MKAFFLRGHPDIDRAELASMKAQLRRDNAKFTDTLVEIPRWKWENLDTARLQRNRCGIYRSRNFLVQVYDSAPFRRLSINRTEIGFDGHFVGGISWDELQQIKDELGYAEHVAVEVYPPKSLIVNVSNMRHLVIFPKGRELPEWVWSNESEGQ